VPDEAWLRRHVGDRIKEKVQVLRGLVAGDRTVVLYAQQEYRPGAREPATGAIRLSVLVGATERLLWEYVDGGAVTSGLVAPPVLAACRSDMSMGGDSNRTWDVFLCASVNTAGGIHNEGWHRQLHVFPGSKAAGAIHIPLAAMDADMEVTDDTAVWSSLEDSSQPALRRDACVIVDPWTRSLVLVAREIRFRSEPDPDEVNRGRVTVKIWRAGDGGIEQSDVKPGDLPHALLNVLGGPTGAAGLLLQ